MPCSDDYQRVSTACRLIATGRSVARQLAAAVRRFGLNETEFRLLWLLHESVTNEKASSLDQRILATELGISPAQVSATVEKLRQQGAIESVADRHDRRRQLWQLTDEGGERFETVCATIEILSRDWAVPRLDGISTSPTQEEAA